MVRRKRSVVWGFFKHIDSETVQCLLCSDYLVRREQGTTTNLLRHLRAKHPSEVKKMKSCAAEGSSTTGGGHQEMETDGEQLCSVEVALEDGDYDTLTTENDADLNSAINGILEAAQRGPAEQAAHEEVTDERPGRRKRSLIWRHFKHLDGLSAAHCCICNKRLHCYEGSSTSNLRRHLSTKHPKLFSQLVADEKNSSLGSNIKGKTSTPSQIVETTESRSFPEVALEDGVCDSHTTKIDANDHSSINSILGAAQRAPAEHAALEEAADECPARRKRTLIWRHFEHLDHLAAARCRTCMKKLQYFEGGSTRHLHMHMSKRHPELFSQLTAEGLDPPRGCSSLSSVTNGDTWTTAGTVEDTERRAISGKVSRAPQREKHLFRKELELIESMRRAQREEARALEHQRELLEKLRAVNAREAAAERRQIDSLRKSQQEEAKELSRQKEELRREKAELQKKWQELQEEREGLILFAGGQQAEPVNT